MDWMILDMTAKKSPDLVAVVNMLFAYQYVNVTTNPSLLVPVMKSLLQSSYDLGRLANATGLSEGTVKIKLTDIYDCVKRTTTYSGGLPMKMCFEVINSTISDSIKYCLELKADTNALVLLVVGVFSCGVLIAGSCINKRRSTCVNCCYGRPAPVVPLNMLDSYENRFGNALAFGVTTSYCLTVLFFDSRNVLGTEIGKAFENVPSSVNLVFKVIATFVISNAAYPLFVCMRTKYKFIGSLFGIFYCSAWLALLALKVFIFYRGCIKKLPAKTEVWQLFEGLSDVPQFICMIVLLIRFSIVLLKHSSAESKAPRRHNESLDEFQEEYLIRHVKNLLKAVSKKRSHGKLSLKLKIKEKVYAWKPEFRYSTRVISAFMVSGITIYMITIKLLFLVWYLDVLLEDFIVADDFQLILKYFQNNGITFATIQTHLGIWIVCLYVAIVLAAIKTFVVFLNMLSWYRGHITRLRRGDKSWLPAPMKSLEASSAGLMAAGMKYAGFQVAYVAWGFIVFAVTLLFFLGIPASFIIYPLIQGESSFLLDLIINGLPTIALSIVVSISQYLSAKFVFLQNKDARTSVNNRTAFHITSYYMFFFNIFLGLFSCLMRIIKGLLIGVTLLERVQKSLLPRSFEEMDPGYFAYVGYILIEHSHANPVLCVFNHLIKKEFKTVKKNRQSVAFLLNEGVELDQIQDLNQRGENSKPQNCSNSLWFFKYDRHKTIRNKWNLFYTLVNNPDLVKYRRNWEENEEYDEEENEEENEEEQEIKTEQEGKSTFYN